MLDQDDLKWIATTSTELNTILQQITRSADLARQHKGEQNYLDVIGERAEVASKTAQALFDRVTSQILKGSVAKTTAPPELARSPHVGMREPVAVGASIASKRSVPSQSALATEKTSTAVGGDSATASGSIPTEIKVLNENGERELLLLVEDEAEVAELAGLTLTDEGYKVIIARDGFEALKIYQQINKKIGLVILDYFLPVMDGDAVFDELCALNPEVAVVLSSGFGEQNKLGNMLARGLRGFIPKPYTREKLLAQVRSILDSTRDSAR